MHNSVTLASVFGDNMVLQRGKPVPVWGKTIPVTTVTVTFARQTKTVTADQDGRWTVTLDPMPASTEPRELTVQSPLDNRRTTVTGVLVGDVWVCAGQSNMETSLAASDNGAAEVARADHPLLRFFRVPHKSAETPQNDCNGTWSICSPSTAGDCFGVSYYFAQHLREHHGVPIGLYNTAWSGACGETWIPLDSLKNHPLLNRRVAEWEQYKRDYPARVEAAKNTPPLKDPNGPEQSLGRLYNGMLHPLIPCAIRGILFYQGENNVLDTETYKVILPFLIREWRRLWNAEPVDLPFLYVQIANFGPIQTEPEDTMWARLRESQMAGLSEPHTAIVTAIDIGGNFHPGNKKDVGIRLALAARANVYGDKSLVWSGPMVKTVSFNGRSVTLTFEHAGSGLIARNTDNLQGFSLAGPDRRFTWADAVITGNTVTVSAPALSNPVALRYAWGTNPIGNLCNAEGLPAFPYRSDEWPTDASPSFDDMESAAHRPCAGGGKR